MIAVLVPWILAVAHDHSMETIVNVGPDDRGDLGLAHRRRNCKADDTPDRNQLTWVAIQMGDERVKLALCWPAVSLPALANQP